jgi:hypothetical protein
MGYIFGLDLGQAQDYSALVLVERTPPYRDETPMLTPVTVPARYQVVYAYRWALGTNYPHIIRGVLTRMHRAPVHGQGRLVLDRTGVGAPVADLFRKTGLRPIPVHVHGGAEMSHGPLGFNVPKRDIVGAVQVLLQQSRLDFAKRMPLMGQLFQELQTFRAKIDTVTAHDSYSAWREQDHDDLCFALALVCWWGERFAGNESGPMGVRWGT